MTEKNREVIEKTFNSATRSKKVHEAVLFVENTKGDFSVNYGYGGKDFNSPLFTASISKLFAAACVLILCEQKKLSLDIYYKNESLYRPKFIKSYNFDVISTAKDLMRFLKAFYGGLLFSQGVFDNLGTYRKLQTAKGPIRYGGGYMQIPMKSILTLFMGKGELIGHSGSTGSFAFYYPEKDLYFVGDLNQMANPELPIRLVMKLAMTVKL